MSDTDTNNNSVISLAQEPCVSPTTTTTTIKVAGIMSADNDCQEAENTIVAQGGGGDADKNNVDENRGTGREYCLIDYFDVRIDSFTGRVRDSFTCPRGDTQCDGFVFASLDECQAHERDWHAGPYRCLVCGQAFGSGPRLRRHVHYAESELRRTEVEAAEACRKGCAAVRVYHGNDLARSRARRFAKMVRAEGMEREKARRRALKKAERMTRQARRNKKAIDDEPPVVIGTQEGAGVAAGGLENGGAATCEEPCCPFFEKTFASSSASARHIAAQGHVVAVAMGEALIQQLTSMVMATASTIVKTPDDHSRACTPPPHRALQLLSPPPTPSTVGDEGIEAATSAWDDEEELPMILERRLNKTRCALRELRCNAPGCGMYGRKMATSQSYWSHLASGQHTAALNAWRERGGEAVYVSA